MLGEVINFGGLHWQDSLMRPDLGWRSDLCLKMFLELTLLFWELTLLFESWHFCLWGGSFPLKVDISHLKVDTSCAQTLYSILANCIFSIFVNVCYLYLYFCMYVIHTYLHAYLIKKINSHNLAVTAGKTRDNESFVCSQTILTDCIFICECFCICIYICDVYVYVFLYLILKKLELLTKR